MCFFCFFVFFFLREFFKETQRISCRLNKQTGKQETRVRPHHTAGWLRVWGAAFHSPQPAAPNSALPPRAASSIPVPSCSPSLQPLPILQPHKSSRRVLFSQKPDFSTALQHWGHSSIPCPSQASSPQPGIPCSQKVHKAVPRRIALSEIYPGQANSVCFVNTPAQGCFPALVVSPLPDL